MLEPLLVRPRAAGGYQVIAGERRYRAATLAGRETVPCLILEVDDAEARAISLVENLQREDLDIEEEARFLAELHAGGMSLRAAFLTFMASSRETLVDRVDRAAAHGAAALPPPGVVVRQPLVQVRL